MKERIRKEAMEIYESIESKDSQSIATFIDQVMDKTSEVLFEEIKKQLKDEFVKGTLKHDFIISPDYYLELKLKEVKQSFSGGPHTDTLTPTAEGERE
jgi:hypothetical protein